MKPEIPLPFDDPAVVILALRVALQKMEAAAPAEQAAMLARAAEAAFFWKFDPCFWLDEECGRQSAAAFVLSLTGYLPDYPGDPMPRPNAAGA